MRISDWSSDVCSSDLPVLPNESRDKEDCGRREDQRDLGQNVADWHVNSSQRPPPCPPRRPITARLNRYRCPGPGPTPYPAHRPGPPPNRKRRAAARKFSKRRVPEAQGRSDGARYGKGGGGSV